MEEPAELLARAEDLTPAGAAPPRVSCGQIEQLERACLRMPPSRHVASAMRANCALHLAAHVRELVDERQLGPPYSGTRMDGGIVVRHRAPGM